MTDATPANPIPISTAADDEAKLISAVTERLQFFFSNANLRQDKWMRSQLQTSTNASLPLDQLLKFNTLKSISTDKALLIKAAQSDALKELIKYNEESESISRVIPFDYKTMGDGSSLSLYVKNVPLTEPPKETEGEDKTEDTKEEEPFRPRYAVTRDELSELFSPYGNIGIIQLKYARKNNTSSSDEQLSSYTSPSQRGLKSGESYPLGAALIEFENEDGMIAACKDLLVAEGGEGDGEEKKEPNKILEIKGNKLVIEKMKPHRMFSDKKKRSRDDEEPEEEEEEVKFEPIKLEWSKGCVITLTGLSTTTCDRESIREAVSETLGVSTDVKTSGLYVDYNRGATTGNLRLTEPKPTEMKELVDKLTDGTITIANEKVESAVILEGEKEEEYWKEFNIFLNNRKRMREEEKRMNARNNKRQRFGGKGGRGKGRGRR